MADRRFLPIIGREKGGILACIVRESRPKRVLEVGALIGYSAILMGKEMGRDSQLITIEIRMDMAKVAEDNIRRACILPSVKVLIGDAMRIIPRLEGMFDLVFLDAQKDDYIEYIQVVEEKLHVENVVVADNAGVLAYQMRDYLDYVRSSGKYLSQYVAVSGDGLEISVKL